MDGTSVEKVPQDERTKATFHKWSEGGGLSPLLLDGREGWWLVSRRATHEGLSKTVGTRFCYR
jgi:hypothetical protein